jgi:hypothetical protein
MNRRQFLATAIGSGGAVACETWPRRSRPAPEWAAILERMPASIRRFIDQPEHEIQLIYTRIDRDVSGRATLTTLPWHLAPHRWFSAASWVKLPAVLLTAERLTALGGDADVRIVLDRPPETGNWDVAEPLDEPFERTVRRLFTVSENVPFNRLYEYLGQREVGEGLVAHGYRDARVIARLGSADVAANRRVGASRLVDRSGRELERRAARENPAAPHFPYGRVFKGRGWQTATGAIEPGPHDFSKTNFLPLSSIHGMLAALMFPDSVPELARWRIAPAMREMLSKELARWPRESSDPVYDPSTYPDAAAKFFVIGGSKDRAPDSLRMFGKSGQAYGYLQDCAYIVDRASGVECLLAATVHANADGIFNDDRYEYEDVGFPLLAALGRAVLEYERERPRRAPARFDQLPTSWT